MTSPNPATPVSSTCAPSKTPAAALKGLLHTLNNALSASSETHVSPILSTLYPPRVTLSIISITDTITKHTAHTFTDAIAALSDAGILGARFIDCSMQSLSYVPARITAAFVGSFIIRGRVVRFYRQVVTVWTGAWRVSSEQFVLFP